jgi:ankyrin repeat protein
MENTMISTIQKLFTDFKYNSIVRKFYASIENADIEGFTSILNEIKDEKSFSLMTPSVLCFICAESKNTKFLVSILNLGCNPDAPNESGQFPLHIAVENGNEEFVQILLEYGADPNIADTNGVAPLHISYSYDKLGHIAEILVANGANLNQRDHLGKRYLM